MREAKFYQNLENKTIRCRLCNHFCSIKNGDSGQCRVRENNSGRLYSLIYGYPAAINVDPIEKKPLFHFHPGSLTYSLGTVGCNFACDNCQNWNISQAQDIKRAISKINFIPPETIVTEAREAECQSIAYTYNEPTIWTEYALDIMRLAREQAIKNTWVSNGFMSTTALKKMLPLLDAINIDLKSFSPKFYKHNCAAELKPILNNLKTIKQSGVHLEITTLIIPTLSDDNDMLSELAQFIIDELGSDTPWHISRFFPEISWQLKDLSPTDEIKLYEAYEIGKNAGLQYVYLGNVPGTEKENTYCPACSYLIISRMGYQIERFDKAGRCPQCDKALDIIG